MKCLLIIVANCNSMVVQTWQVRFSLTFLYKFFKNSLTFFRQQFWILGVCDGCFNMSNKISLQDYFWIFQQNSLIFQGFQVFPDLSFIRWLFKVFQTLDNHTSTSFKICENLIKTFQESIKGFSSDVHISLISSSSQDCFSCFVTWGVLK